MPVEFPKTIRLNVYVGSCSIGFLEVRCRILYLGPTTRRDHLLLRGQAEYIRIGNVAVRRHFGLFVGETFLGRRNGAPENVRVHGRNILESGDVEAEILSDNLDRGMDEPVGKHECGPSGVEVTVGK